MRIPTTQQSNPKAYRDIQRREPGTVSVCFVAAALEAARQRDLDVDGLLAQVGLSPALLDIPQARISAQHYECKNHYCLRLQEDQYGYC